MFKKIDYNHWIFAVLSLEDYKEPPPLRDQQPPKFSQRHCLELTAIKFLYISFFFLISGYVIAEQPALVTVSLAPASTVISSSRANVDSVELFNGISYAQPSLGQLRLKPPQRLNGPLGTFDSKKTAPTCPQFHGTTPAFGDAFTQSISSSINTTFFETSLPSSEDCLTHNIVRPGRTALDTKLPVLLWIHGGGFQVTYKPVTYIAINYRLAGYGFLGCKEILTDGSANVGLRDQRMALEWVSDNLAAFGGDPTKITIWGESAGPLSHHELFRADLVNCPKAQSVYDTVVKNAGCHTANDTRNVDYGTFEEATNSVPGFISYNSIALSYLPRPDGELLIDSTQVIMQSEKYAAVSLIIGGQEDEGTLFSFTQSNISDKSAVVEYLSSLYFHGATKRFASEIYPGFKRLSALLGGIAFTLARRAMVYHASKADPTVLPKQNARLAGYGRYVFKYDYTCFRTIDLSVTYDVEPVLFWNWLMQVLYNPILALVKSSILIFLLRLGDHRRSIRWSIYILNAFNIALMIAIFITVIFQTIPINTFWDLSIEKQRQIDGPFFYVSTAIITIITDFFVLLIPLWVFLGLGMRLASKIGLIIIFLMGGLATIAAILRVDFLRKQLYNLEPNYDMRHSLIGTLSSVEGNLAIIVCCGPALRLLFRKMFPGLFSNKSSKKHGDYNTPSRYRTGAGVRDMTGNRSFPLKDMHLSKMRAEIRGHSSNGSKEGIMTYNDIIRSTAVNILYDEATLSDPEMGREPSRQDV
ncbi:hypothetical protein FOYG_02116 [Fusarium oxysporum NRRL 32931]|uniref:Uncharacterized protein n=1 Tax=Fusarium oxysporum NRRL 32931 TaxID=660029 RepID=W9JBA6_FUSOX|nr:hypothetical protein FOYG_02116 [Fusarium oxysporum NRRL 32931]